MISPIYSLNGTREFLVRKFNVTSQTIAKGALVKIALGVVTPAGADVGATAANIVFGVTAKAVVAADTTCEIIMIGPDTVLEADIAEILEATALAADSGSGTTFVLSTIDGAANDQLIGSKIEVITMASADAIPGTKLTLTDYATGTGTLTFASVGSTGFAAADTAKFVSLGQSLIGSRNLNLTAASDRLSLNAASATANKPSFICVGISDDGKKAQIVCHKTVSGNGTLS